MRRDDWLEMVGQWVFAGSIAVALGMGLAHALLAEFGK